MYVCVRREREREREREKENVYTVSAVITDVQVTWQSWSGSYTIPSPLE